VRFDFNEIIDRRGTHCEKWDSMEERYGVSPGDGIAMWVADMEFRPPPEVNEALRRSAEHGIHGYSGNLSAYYDSIVNWMARRHGWEIEPDWIVTTPGIVSAVNLLIQAFCGPGDKVLIQPPVYYPFFSAVTANGCRLSHNRLVNEDGRYRMDLEDLERRIDPDTRMIILCSPHNPGGRVWKRSELERVAEVCFSKNVLVVSDEIHHDLVYGSNTHTVLASLESEAAHRVITCTSASKTFNLAGTMTGNVIISDEGIREKFRAQVRRCGLGQPNSFGITAATAAYTHGEPWLEDLIVYLEKNRDRIDEACGRSLPGVISMPLQSTYLAWLDFSGTGLPMKEVIRRVQEEARLVLNHGSTFGPGGESFLRLNFACPRAILEEALDRLSGAFADV
jgi:cystathionine beta-lyase